MSAQLIDSFREITCERRLENGALCGMHFRVHVSDLGAGEMWCDSCERDPAVTDEERWQHANEIAPEAWRGRYV